MQPGKKQHSLYDHFKPIAQAAIEQTNSAHAPWHLIDAQDAQIDASAKTGAKFIELHTGSYADAKGEVAQAKELAILTQGCQKARQAGLRVNAGHGLTYWNVRSVAAIEGMEELNIGHTIVSRAILVGIERAVQDMKLAMRGQF